MLSAPFLPKVVQLGSHRAEHRGEEIGEKGVDGHNEQTDDDHGDDDAADGVHSQIALAVGQLALDRGNAITGLVFDALEKLFHVLRTPFLPVGVELLLHAVEHASEEAGEKGPDSHNEQADENDGNDDAADGVHRKVALAVGQLAVSLGHTAADLVSDVLDCVLHVANPP